MPAVGPNGVAAFIELDEFEIARVVAEAARGCR